MNCMYCRTPLVRSSDFGDEWNALRDDPDTGCSCCCGEHEKVEQDVYAHVPEPALVTYLREKQV